MTLKKLSAGQVAGYERDGYVSPIDAFSPAQARAWRDRLEAFEGAEGRKMTRGHNFKPHLLFPWVDGPNRSHDRRIGLGISYIPTHASCTARRRITAMLVRGQDSYGHFDDERRPIAEAGPAERAFHAEAVARFRGVNADVSGDVTVAS